MFIRKEPARIAIGLVTAGLLFAVMYFCRPLLLFHNIWVLQQTYLLLIPAVIAFLSVYSGMLFGILAGAGAIAGAFMLGGYLGALVALIALVLPAAIANATFERRLPFEQSMRICIVGQLALSVAALALLRFELGDIAAANAAWFENAWNGMDSLGKQQVLNLAASAGYFPQELLSKLSSPINSLFGPNHEYAKYVAYNIYDYTNVRMIGDMFGGALLSGVLMVAWPRMTAVRHALEPTVPFISLEKWRLTGAQTGYSAALFFITLLAAQTLPAWGTTVYWAIHQCVYVIFCIQCAAALERYLKRSGTQRGARGAAVFFITVLFTNIGVIIGVVSAFFGSEGVFTKFMNKLRDDDDDNNGDE